jgi:hypothetical protein
MGSVTIGGSFCTRSLQQVIASKSGKTCPTGRLIFFTGFNSSLCLHRASRRIYIAYPVLVPWD